MSLSVKNIVRNLSVFIFVGLLLANTILFTITITPVSAAPDLTLKWVVNPGNTMTLIGPLAADLIPGRPGLEIVVTGGSSLTDTHEYDSNGDITVLDGRDGSVVWRGRDVSSGYPIGIHQPFEIADLDNDGTLEIVLSLWSETVALRGNNGDLYWRTRAPGDDLFPAVADIDGDGYSEVFVSSGDSPYVGYDWITSLSYDGNILGQAYSWHPCFGGLTIGDTNFDGVFELYQGDRGSGYSPSGDPYQGGGMGPRALNPYTMTPLWNDPTPLSSSLAPMLADVDKDGILDVIVADQDTNGIVVYNSADGSIVTTGGIYRKGGTGMPPHSQPTVVDIDGDGNLEFISGSNSQVKVWDLYDWILDAALVDEFGNPLIIGEPPKAGDVTGDGEVDLIVVPQSSPENPYENQKYSIYIYNSTFNLVEKQSALWDGPRAFTLVQDVDNDGLNELILTSSGGKIYCYDTEAPAPTPRVRSTNAFYSEYKRGVAEHVPPPTPLRPVIRDEYPSDGSFDHMPNPTLSVYVSDFQGNPMDIVFSTNASGTWMDIGSDNGYNRIYSISTSNLESNGTIYYWRVNATDTVTNGWTSETYSFSTYSHPPTHSNPLLNSTGGTNGTYHENLTGYNQTTIDPDGNEVTNIYNWYVNDVSLTGLVLPFDTRPRLGTSTPPSFTDGFEDGWAKWDGNGATTWDRAIGFPVHSGSYSAHADESALYLTSDNIDASDATSILVSFWYRDDDVDDDDNVYLQFGDGSSYRNIFELGNTSPEDEWHYYSVWWRTIFWYGVPQFRIRFNAAGIDAGENLWIDDVTIILEEGDEPATAKDYSGYSNDGTVAGATWTSEGVSGGAYVFDGNDRITVQENSPGSLGGDGSWTEISVEFWFKATTTTGTERLIEKHAPGDTSTVGYRVEFRAYGSSNYLRWRVYTPSTNTLTYYIYDEPSAWHHVVLTYESGVGQKIFVDGVEVESSSASGTIQATGDGPVEIGYYSGSGDFSGVVDEVRIYSRALTSFQVSQRHDETEAGLSNSSTVVWHETEVGEDWKCQVTPNDGFVDGEPLYSNTLNILSSTNTPPAASNLTILPESPTTTDDLTASYDYFDANGDPEFGSEIRWYKDNVLQPSLNNSLTVPSSLTERGQEWNFTFRPKDFIEFGDLQASIITIQNSPPFFMDVYIAPDPAFNTSTLTADSLGWFDADGDSEDYVYQWQIWIGGTWQNIFGEWSQTLDSGNFEAGDHVNVLCIAYDGTDYGMVRSESVLIATFTSLENPLLVSSLGTNTTDEDLICYNHTADGAVTNIYNWYRNDSSITTLLMPFDTDNSTIAKDYSGYGNDGVVSGATWTSDGQVGGAYEFDGDDIIVVPDDTSLGGKGTWDEISVEYWVRTAAPLHGTRIVARKIASASTGSYMTGFQTSTSDPDNTVFWGITVDGTWYDIWDTTHTVLNTGEWYHVMCTYESGPGLTIYINGIERVNMPLAGYIDYDNDEMLFIGSSGEDDSVRYLDGTLDEVRIYSMALTPEQIAQHYIETKDGLIRSSTIVSEETAVGEVWKCQVIPNTGLADGTPLFSNTLTITEVSTVQYELVIEVVGNGTTVPAPGGYLYFEGSNVSVDALPDSGWVLSHWMLDGGNGSAVNPIEVTMNSNHTLTAVFVETSPAYLVVRGSDNRIYYRVYNSSADSWESWNVVPSGTTGDRPAAAIYSDELHIVVRGANGNSLWFGSVNLTDNSFSGWEAITGATPSAPTLVQYDSQLILVVRGLNNQIYYRIYNGTSREWEGWTALPSGATSDGPAATILGDKLHIVVRGFSTTSVNGNNSLWYGSVDLSTPTRIFSGWTSISGSTATVPTLTGSQVLGKLYLVVRGMNDAIYYNTWNSSVWEGWTALPSGATSDGPAATTVGETLHIVVRGIAETTLWHYDIDLLTDDHSGWEYVSGVTPSAPTLTS